MSTSIFKAQASRLAQHLADKHGIKLKHASVLEAIAALHGARDWNTLSASTTAGEGLQYVGAPKHPLGQLPMAPISSASLEEHMATLLAGVRHCQPKCAVCVQPFKDVDDVRTRETEAGRKEQLCRSCFLSEIAEQVAAGSPA